MATQPIQYTSRTFTTALADINAVPELAGKPNWFKTMIAGLHDVFGTINNGVANDVYLRTAFTRQSVRDLLALIDYQLGSQGSASGEIIFYVNRSLATFPINFSALELAANSQGGLAQTALRYESRTGVAFSAPQEGFTADSGTGLLTIVNTYRTGDLVLVSSDDTLPAGLTTGVDYYVISVSATTIRLASSLANAYQGTALSLGDNGTGNHLIRLWSFSVPAFQQTTPDTPPVIGESDGTTPFQEFDLPNNFVLQDTLTLTINSVEWTRVDSLVNSQPTDRHFKFIPLSNGRSRIQFGNGEYGAIPGDFEIFANYSYGGRAISNQSRINIINSYAGTSGDITGASNPVPFTGGADEQSIALAKVLGPLLLRVQERFVFTTDGNTLAQNFEGVALSRTNRLAFGLLSAQVVIVPNGGGDPSAQLISDLEDFLINATVLESIDVRVAGPDYNPQSGTVNVKILQGYQWPAVRDRVRFALIMLFTEQNREIKDLATSLSTNELVSLINTRFGLSFLPADYTQLLAIIENAPANTFNKTFQESDTLGFIDSHVDGVDYLNTDFTFPIANGLDQITQAGTFTIVEIP